MVLHRMIAQLVDGSVHLDLSVFQISAALKEADFVRSEEWIFF